MELNREQIIKALECCTRKDCSMATNADCPLIDDEFCAVKLPHYALALIKAISEENERLRWGRYLRCLISTAKTSYCKHCGHALDWGKESEDTE